MISYLLQIFISESNNSGIIIEGDKAGLVSQNCPTSPLMKLREKWFYIGYIKTIFQKTNSKLWKPVNISPLFQICRIIPVYSVYTIDIVIYMLICCLFQSLLTDEQVANAPVLILGNKIDIPGAASEDEIRMQFGLHGQTTGRVCYIMI